MPRHEIRHLLPHSPLTCFVVRSLFTPAQCDELLSYDIRQSFQKAIGNYPTYYRNNDRLVVDSEQLATSLFNKVSPYLPATIDVDTGPAAAHGRWQLLQLNPRIRYCRYGPKQYFHRHLDGVHHHSPTVQSKLTFMLYLNSATDFKGGRTLFYKTKDSTDIWAAYTPLQGDLIIFDHMLWHEGETLQEGEKFVLRSDILYQKEQATINPAPFSGHMGYIWRLAKFSNDILLSGGRDKAIKVWSNHGKLLQDLYAHHNSILCIEPMDHTTFISGSRDKQVIVWQQAADRSFFKLRSISAHTAAVLSLCRLSDTLFASAGGDGLINICSTDGTIVKTLQGHTNWVWQVVNLGDDIIASCAEDGQVILWNIPQDTHLTTFAHAQPIICLAYLPGSKKLVCGGLDGSITVRTLGAAYSTVAVGTFMAHNGIVRTIEVIDENRIATGGEDNRVRIWNLESGSQIAEFLHHDFVQSVALVDERTIMSASYDGTIMPWQI